MEARWDEWAARLRRDAKYEGRDAQRLDAQHDSPVFRQRRKTAPEHSSFKETLSVVKDVLVLYAVATGTEKVTPMTL